MVFCHRFFFALRPPERLAHGIAAFADEIAEDGYRITARRLHVTVAITQDYDERPDYLVDTMLRVGEAITSAPCPLRLDRLVQGNTAVLLMPGPGHAELRALHRAIADGMASARAPLRKGASFSPHMTLLYRKGAPLDRRIAGFEWTAQELELIHSHVGRRWHETLGRWPLRAVQPAQFALF